MKKFIPFLLIIAFACNEKKQISSINPEIWEKRYTTISENDSLENGKTYLSIYSQIYSFSEQKTHNLTSMVSFRNTSDLDTIYITKAEYFDTHGKSVRTYFDNKIIFLAPMETVEIIIDELDNSGGTGSNFLIHWKKPTNCPEPLFEGIMSSTIGQQGLSFTTQGKRIK